MSGPFPIPGDFRAFMRAVVTQIDLPPDQKFVDDDEAFQHECGHGGRSDGGDAYQFTYITPDGHHRWELELREQQIRDIADGVLTEVEALRDDMVRTRKRQPRGQPLLVWGEYRDDALRIQHAGDLMAALDALHAAAQTAPRMLRLWSAGDDQLVAVIRGDECALYIIESFDGYGTSRGNSTRTDAFELVDHDGRPFAVPLAECVPWALAKRALVHFADAGQLGPEVALEGRVPSGFLMLGDADRVATIAMRGEPPDAIVASSLPRLAPPLPDPFADWAAGLLASLAQLELIAVDAAADVADALAGLLQFHGDAALADPATAEWLRAQLAALRGVLHLDATSGDLQLALRRSRQLVTALA